MDANPGLKPSFLKRDGVRLAYFEAGPAHGRTPPLILVNGWTGDHRIFTPQIDHFAKSRRVVAIDLRGHGASDAPKQEYTWRDLRMTSPGSAPSSGCTDPS